jgi:5-methyltetrahydropteroyltriglutamate--homocysteine methyltransferase
VVFCQWTTTKYPVCYKHSIAHFGNQTLRLTLPQKADHVGSLLRPDSVRECKLKHRLGEASAAELAAVEDTAILAQIEGQIQAGLLAITDGETRRDYWHLDFLVGLQGFELQASVGMAFQGVSEIPPTAVVSGKIAYQTHPMLAHYQFLHAHTPATHRAKFTLPSPAMAHMRGGSSAINRAIYPNLDHYWQDLCVAYQAAIAELYAAGCRYLQIDDITFAYLADPAVAARCREHGDDPAILHRRYAEAINLALANRPADMLVTLHTCRGNFQSTWVAEAPYQQAIIESLFSTNVDAYFMEFDSARAGGFEVLRALPEDKTVVLGLITSKHGELENAADIAERVQQASRVVPLDRLALSPQCGFSSTHHGNKLSPDAQWQKLRHVVQIANTIWSST